MEDRTMIDRRSLSLREVVMLATLLLNFGGLVWGAATITRTVAELQVAVSNLTSTVRGLAEDIASIKVDYNARIRVLEDRQERSQ